jgi:hypothetical protein
MIDKALEELVEKFIKGEKRLVINTDVIFPTSTSIVPTKYKHTFAIEDVE